MGRSQHDINNRSEDARGSSTRQGMGRITIGKADHEVSAVDAA